MDYLTLAATAARSHLQRLADETHWIDYDQPVSRGRAQAACSSIVETAKFSRPPTCTACRQQQAIVDTYEF
jgi:hypothetical protein